MILELYSIYDKKLGEFLPPFCCKNEEDAIRMCSNLVNHSDSLMLKFPDDYSCEKVAEFDTESSQCDSAYKDYEMKQVKIEFNTLVKDETIKYKDVLTKVDQMLTQAGWFIKAAPEKFAEIDKYVNLAKIKYEELNNVSNKVEHTNTSVDCPDFIPVNNNTKSKKSFLDKLFS